MCACVWGGVSIRPPEPRRHFQEDTPPHTQHTHTRVMCDTDVTGKHVNALGNAPLPRREGPAQGPRVSETGLIITCTGSSAISAQVGGLLWAACAADRLPEPLH